MNKLTLIRLDGSLFLEEVVISDRIFRRETQLRSRRSRVTFQRSSRCYNSINFNPPGRHQWRRSLRSFSFMLCHERRPAMRRADHNRYLLSDDERFKKPLSVASSCSSSVDVRASPAMDSGAPTCCHVDHPSCRLESTTRYPMEWFFERMAGALDDLLQNHSPIHSRAG